jgi:uncharacterized membrane-anchored protein
MRPAAVKPGRLAFGLLLLGEAILLGMVVVAGARYPGYDHARQYISELGATGAVDGWAVSWVGFVAVGTLTLAFCLIAAWLMRRNVLGVIGWLLLGLNAYAYLNSAWYRCDFECAGDSPAQMMHNLFGGLGYLAGCLGLVLAGLSAKVARWLTVLGVVCAAVAFLGLSGMGEGSEFRGLFQRVTESAIAVFMLAFGWALANGRIGEATVRP